MGGPRADHGSPRAAHQGCSALHGRVLIQDSSKKANPRSSGQEAVVVNILGNEW